MSADQLQLEADGSLVPLSLRFDGIAPGVVLPAVPFGTQRVKCIRVIRSPNGIAIVVELAQDLRLAPDEPRSSRGSH